MTRHNWTMAEYLASPALGASSLSAMAMTSPLDFHSLSEDERETDPMRLGTATHCLTTEPHNFAESHAVWRHLSASGKLSPRNPSSKAWVDFSAANKGKNIITPAQYDDAKAQADCMRNALDTGALLVASGGEAEPSFTADMETHAVKIRPDWLTPSACVEIRTVRTTNPRKLWQLAYDRGWHIKAALYVDVLQLNGMVRDFYYIVCRNYRPYYAKALLAPLDFLECGRDEYGAALEKIAECQASGEWPGDLADHQTIELPAHVKRRRELELIL